MDGSQLVLKNPVSSWIVRGMANEPCHTVKDYRVTLTGITKLKDGKGSRGYNGRYWCCPGYVDRADGGIWERKKSMLQDAVKTDKTVPRAKVIPGIDPGQIPEKEKPAGYRLNKKEIGHRMRGMFNTVRHCAEKGKGYRNKKAVMYFFTVTFPVGTGTDTCYKLLNTWLTTLRQDGKLKSYLWVAEKQKNGTTHFHICIPHYLNVKDANAIMRKSIIFLINKKQISWSVHAAQKYNGVDIAKDRKTKRVVNFADQGKQRALSRYITKYVSKNNEQHDRQPWHCSRDWSALVKGVHITQDQLKILCGPSDRMIRKGVFENEYVQFWGWKDWAPGALSDHLAELNFYLVQSVTGGTNDNIFSL